MQISMTSYGNRLKNLAMFKQSVGERTKENRPNWSVFLLFL